MHLEGIIGPMNRYTGKLLIFAAILASFLAAGCTFAHKVKAKSNEDLLKVSGFTAKPVDSAEAEEKFRTLPPLALTKAVRKGKNYYLYADPYRCHCVYVGNESQYEQFLILKAEREATEDDIINHSASAVIEDNWWWWGE
jgi:hypothetical protein